MQIESATGKTLDLEIDDNRLVFKKSVKGDYFFMRPTLIPMVTPSDKQVAHKLIIATNASVFNIGITSNF